MSLNSFFDFFFKENFAINFPPKVLKTNNVLISSPNNISSFSIKTELSWQPCTYNFLISSQLYIQVEHGIEQRIIRYLTPKNTMTRMASSFVSYFSHELLPHHCLYFIIPCEVSRWTFLIFFFLNPWFVSEI